MNYRKVLVGSMMMVLTTGISFAGNGKSGYGHSDNFRNKHCTPFELHVKGGKGGVRFMHNIGNFKLVKHGIYRGKTCQTGRTTVELSRTNPNTKVVLFMNGQKYVFHRGERAHRLHKTWHRKYVNFYLPGQKQKSKQHGYASNRWNDVFRFSDKNTQSRYGHQGSHHYHNDLHRYKNGYRIW